MPLRLTTKDAGFEAAFATFLGGKREVSEDVHRIVDDIVRDVKANGDAALRRYTAKFDRFEPSSLLISQEERKDALSKVDPETLEALKFAAARIQAYHEKQFPDALDYVDDQGVRLGGRWTAIQAVGLYVPGGTAAYPSSVLMNAIPAKVAGVERLVMVVPTPDGLLNPLVLAAAEIAGVDEIYRVGGAQAIAALAHGTESIAPVYKIVGPGNAFVAAAKAQVFGTVGIDMIAGPSEILVVSDDQSNPDWIAADLLSQAEHDVSAQSILVTDSAAFADDVDAAVARALTTLPRAEIAAESWDKHGASIVVEQLDDAVHLIDQLAPEHCEVALDTEAAFAYGEKIRNVGSLFLGRHTPEAVGDYVAGPNHVLPTARSAKFSSGLNVLEFMKRTSILSCDANALRNVGPAAMQLAAAEGLDGHAKSIGVRLNMGDAS